MYENGKETEGREEGKRKLREQALAHLGNGGDKAPDIAVPAGDDKEADRPREAQLGCAALVQHKVKNEESDKDDVVSLPPLGDIVTPPCLVFSV